MKNRFFIAFLVFLSCFTIALAQKEEKIRVTNQEELAVFKDSIAIDKKGRKVRLDPLAPARAAFYSAVVPGLGQAYNRKYWKIPIVYGLLGATLYSYFDNNKDYKRFRDAYKRRLQGFEDDEFYFDSNGNLLTNPTISTDRLIDAQDRNRRDRDFAMLLSVLVYGLNVIDANVDAHLMQFNVNDDLTLKPNIQLDQQDLNPNFGLSLNYNLGRKKKH